MEQLTTGFRKWNVTWGQMNRISSYTVSWPELFFLMFTASVIFCQKMLTSMKVLKSFTIFQFVDQYISCGVFVSQAHVTWLSITLVCCLMDRPPLGAWISLWQRVCYEFPTGEHSMRDRRMPHKALYSKAGLDKWKQGNLGLSCPTYTALLPTAKAPGSEFTGTATSCPVALQPVGVKEKAKTNQLPWSEHLWAGAHMQKWYESKGGDFLGEWAR